MHKIEDTCFKTIEYQRVVVHDIDTNAIIGKGYCYYIENEKTESLEQNLSLTEMQDSYKILPPGNYKIEFSNEFGIAILPARIQ